MRGKVKQILSVTHHREYPLPARPWQHFQQWTGNIMLHYRVDADLLQPYIPQGVALDLFDGAAYVSIIAFTVNDLQPRWLPPVPFLSDFHEINLRTYVIRDGKPGIYFLLIDAGKSLSAFLARNVLGLPYRKAQIKRKEHYYYGQGPNTLLDITYIIGTKLHSKSNLDVWLTERHCMYENIPAGLFRIDIHHRPWELRNINIDLKIIKFPFCDALPSLAHYSHKADVLFWNRIFLI